MNEFELIQHYFAGIGTNKNRVALGIGDDAAIIHGSDEELLVCTDTMVAGVHFPDNCNPQDIGYKLLAVNLSDLAAMGAEPAWCLLNLTLPEFDAGWRGGRWTASLR